MRKFFNLCSIITAAILSLLLVSCSGLFSSLSEGAITVSLPGASAAARSASDGTDITNPDAIARYELEFNMGDQTKKNTALPGEKITQDGLEPGTWKISCRALTTDNICIGYGTSSAEVAAGKTSDAVLAMTFNSYANLASIAVTKNPAKTEYTIGDTVDYTGIEITAIFKSGWKCVLDTSSLKDSLTCSPAEGSTLTSFTDKVTVTLKTDNASVSADFPITVSLDAPKIQSVSPSAFHPAESTSYTVFCTASCISGGSLTFSWYEASTETGTGTSVSGGETPVAVDGVYKSTLTVSSGVKGTHYYYCVVTNTNSGKTASSTSERTPVTVLATSSAFSSFAAKLGSDITYLAAGTTPVFTDFTITETWTVGENSTTTQADSADYTISLPTGTENSCGTIPVTITRTDPTTKTTSTETVDVTFKYDITVPSIDAVAVETNEAQYTGTSTISTTVTNASHTYYDAENSKTVTFYDTVKYQWQKGSTAYGDITTTSEATSTATCTPDASTAGSYKYTLTASVTGNTSYKDYCTGTVPEAVTSGAWPVTVTPWTAKFNNDSVDNDSTLTIAMGKSPSLVISNENDTTSSLTVTPGDTGTATVSQNVTAGNAITITPVKAGSTTLTVTAGTSTLMTFSVNVTKAVSSITAALTDSTSYLLVGSKPAAGMFTVTKHYDDSSTATATSAEYTVEAADTSKVGDITVTVTLTADTSKTCTVTVPYKYTMTATTFGTASAVKEAQYTGTTGLSLATAKSGCTVSELNTTGYDKVSYQWYKSTNVDLSNAATVGTAITGTDTISSDTVTCTPDVTAAGTYYYYCVATTTSGTATYCTNSAASLTSQSDTIAVTVTPWTLSLTDTTGDSSTPITIENGGTQELTAGHSYSMQFANADADTTSAAIAGNSAYVSWASDNTATLAAPAGSAPWTFTAPSATSAAQTITLTATLTIGTSTTAFGKVTFTVPAEVTGTEEATFAALKTAVESLESGQSGTFIIPSTFTTATTDTAAITVKGNVTINAASGTSTITRLTEQKSIALFTVETSGTLNLGTAGGSLVIDGGYTSASIKAEWPLIYSAGDVTIGSNCTLQNNCDTADKGGALYMYSSATRNLTVNGTIQNNYAENSSGKGGGIYINAGASYPTQVTMTDAQIKNNTSQTHGGGLYFKNATGTMTNVTISGNTANYSTDNVGGGGGLFLSGTGSSIELKGTTSITGNTAVKSGGGIYINSCTLKLTAGSITSNTATTGSNVYLIAGTYMVSSDGGTTYTTNSTNGSY